MLGVVLLGMTGAVLLTVCLNLASMLLARGRGRRKEFAVRLALGGGRFRIVRQLLVEGLLLSLVGGALGVMLGQAAIERLMGEVSTLLPITITLDGQVSTPLIAATTRVLPRGDTGLCARPGTEAFARRHRRAISRRRPATIRRRGAGAGCREIRWSPHRSRCRSAC